ncbi:Uma2 family endonuclease [Sorangium cellulosum]|nr:Uma2 family endonuclease [Sorangium cellulosum]
MGSRATAEILHPEPMTLEQWADMDEDEPGELLDGRLVEEEAPTTLHEAVVSWLIEVLRRWARPRGGWVFGSEHKLGVSARRGRKADVCMYAPGTRLRGRDALSRIPPTVAVEVLSRRPRDVRRDRMEKAIEYARFGVRWYWLVDPDAQLVEIWQLGPDGHYVQVQPASEGMLRIAGLEGLELDLDALWIEVAPLLEDEDDDQAVKAERDEA